MANEISLNLQLKINNPAGSQTGYVESRSMSKLYNQNVLGANAEIVSVPTTATTYTFAGVTTNGYMYIQNLDATNYAEWGISGAGTFYPVGKIEAGEIAFFRMMPGITFQMQANTAAVNISYLLLND